MKNREVCVVYIPVLHMGYLSFIEELEKKGVEALYLVSDDILGSHEELDYIHRKDTLRALPHEVMKGLLKQITTIPIFSLTMKSIMELQHERISLVMPREDINVFIGEMYFGGHSITYENVFLRFNRENVGEEKTPDTEKIALSDFQKTAIHMALTESEKSTDWWRQVGAVLVQNREVIAIAHNEHMPEKELPNIFGDTRALFKKGTNINYVTTAHAEASAVADCARQGVSAGGAELFTTDFPCPYCARVIAKAGIKKIYYLKGYAVLGGDDFFKEMGIETVKVDITE